MKPLVLLTAAAALSFAVCAEPIIRCEPQTQGAGIEPVVIELNAVKKFGESLNCIEGASPGDMEPCAPSGGWGLSYPTGAAQLRAVVHRPQDFGDHDGGMMFSGVSNTRLTFEGGFRWTDGSQHGQWRFIADRTTGLGELALQESDSETLKLKARYACRGVKRKF